MKKYVENMKEYKEICGKYEEISPTIPLDLEKSPPYNRFWDLEKFRQKPGGKTRKT